MIAPRCKRLGLRYDRTQRTLRPLLTLGCVLVNLRRLVQKGVLRPGLKIVGVAVGRRPRELLWPRPAA